MGPFCEEKQMDRAMAIQSLLDRNPDMEPSFRAIWKRHLINIAWTEPEYNRRVKEIYSGMKRSVIDYDEI